MCGRGAAASEANQYANQIKKLTHQQIIVSGTCAFAPSSNLAPGRNVPVLVYETGENRNEKQKMSVAAPFRLQSMIWGLVPSHTKLTSGKPDHFRLMNARMETAGSLFSFRNLVRRRRCAVVLDGWFEWKEDHLKQKQPWYCFLRASNGEARPIVLAALFDEHKSIAETGGSTHESVTTTSATVLQTVTLLTTVASSKLQWLHHRMPCILNENIDHHDGFCRSKISQWLDPAVAPEQALALLDSYSDDDLQWHPVTKNINSISYKGEDCTTPIKVLKPKPITSFWGNNRNSNGDIKNVCSSEPLAVSKKMQSEAPESQSQVDFSADKKQLICPACTFINTRGSIICSMCEGALIEKTADFDRREGKKRARNSNDLKSIKISSFFTPLQKHSKKSL